MAQVSTNLTRNLDSRSTNMKRELLEKFGGTAASEKAVAAALKWIASHQLRNGSWSFAHNRACQGQCGDPGHMQAAVNGATAISLLPFLGAGQTHLDGAYKENVRRGLDFLIKNMDVKGGEVPRGSWHENPGNMYSHGLAAIAICEAYAMTRDPDLIQPAQLALNYIVWSQDPVSGGWRYGPQQAGDTSVVGWQVMALKSGSMGNLFVPPTTVQKASFFLDTVQSSDGTTYGYTDPGSTGGHKPCTPIGLLCRMYLGMDKSDPAIKEGVAKLAKEGVQKNDIYYNYYAAQVLRQHGGPEWETFNGQLRDWLVETQVKGGHADGSWHFGDSIGHRGPSEGGRLCSTAFATMILEVYYRHMPLYGDKAGEDSFEL